jgi:hypothetical protein
MQEAYGAGAVAPVQAAARSGGAAAREDGVDVTLHEQARILSRLFAAGDPEQPQSMQRYLDAQLPRSESARRALIEALLGREVTAQLPPLS